MHYDHNISICIEMCEFRFVRFCNGKGTPMNNYLGVNVYNWLMWQDKPLN